MPLGLDKHFYQYVLPLALTETCFLGYAFSSDARSCQVIFGLVGLWWCLAALWVEVQIAQVYPNFDHDSPPDPEMKAYRPFCDFAPWATCSKVLMSPSGRFLRFFGIALEYKGEWGDDIITKVRHFIDVPNPTLGVMFFSCHLFYNVLVDIVYLLPAPLSGFANIALPWCFFIACCGVGCMAVWLAYKLFFVLKDFCVVCVSMYIVIFSCIPMMHHVAGLDSHLMLGFGAVPPAILYPFLLLDATMFVAVWALYLGGPAHHSMHGEVAGHYKQLFLEGA